MFSLLTLLSPLLLLLLAVAAAVKVGVEVEVHAREDVEVESGPEEVVFVSPGEREGDPLSRNRRSISAPVLFVTVWAVTKRQHQAHGVGGGGERSSEFYHP